VLHKEEKAQV